MTDLIPGKLYRLCAPKHVGFNMPHRTSTLFLDPQDDNVLMFIEKKLAPGFKRLIAFYFLLGDKIIIYETHDKEHAWLERLT